MAGQSRWPPAWNVWRKAGISATEELQRTDGRYALAACVGVGRGSAIILNVSEITIHRCKNLKYILKAAYF